MQQVRIALWSIAVLLSSQAAAQDRVDFSGVWKMDLTRSDSAHQAVPIGPVTLIIKQSATDLSIETRRTGHDKPVVQREILHYRLDGSERSSGSGGAEVKSKAHWDGPKLIAEAVRSVDGATVTTMHVFSLDPGGKELTVDKTLTIQHGYQFEGAKNTGTGKDVFVKGKSSN